MNDMKFLQGIIINYAYLIKYHRSIPFLDHLFFMVLKFHSTLIELLSLKSGIKPKQ